MYIKQYDICIKDSLFKPSGRIAKKLANQSPMAYFKKQQTLERKVQRTEKKAEKRNLYKVWIYLDGKDTPFVKRVTYRLHSSFQHPVNQVEQTPENPNCSLSIWTWGIFKVKIEIEFVNGLKVNKEHTLTYGALMSDRTISWQEKT